MRRSPWFALACVLAASPALGQPVGGSDTTTKAYDRVYDSGGNALPRRGKIQCLGTLSCADNPATGRTEFTASGGAGGGDVTGPGSSTDNEVTRFSGTTGKIIQDGTGCLLGDDGKFSGTCEMKSTHGASTCMIIPTSTTVFMGMGTCADLSEAMVEQPFERAATISRLRCMGSHAQGVGNNITVTARVGTCGSLASSLLICTLTGAAGRATCSSGGTTVGIAASECLAFRVVTPGTLSNAPAVNCTFEEGPA